MENKIDFVDLKTQYRTYKPEIDNAIQNILNTAQFIQGKEVASLEDNLSAYTGSKHCISCSSGTDALLLALLSLGISTDDEVITTPFTFFATAEAISLLGAKPVFVDIEDKTYNIDASMIKERINTRTKAIIPVSIFGQPCDMDEINQIASEAGIPVIEDAAQSFGSTYKGKKSCNLSTIGTTSFFPAKPLGCYGDGGAVFTSDDSHGKKIRLLMNHGQEGRGKHKYIGINGRLDAIQAAILNIKLKYYNKEISKRNSIAERYTNGLTDIKDIITPAIKKDRTSNFAQYTIRVNNRAEFVNKMSEINIPTAIHYPIPLYQQEVYQELKIDSKKFPVTEMICNEVVSLPMCPYLKKGNQDFIIDTIQNFSGVKK